MNFNFINIFLSAFIVICCFVFIYFILFTELLADRLAGQYKYVFVSILALYAGFRGYRLYKELRK